MPISNRANRGAQRLHSREPDLTVDRAVVLYSEAQNQRAKCETLQHEGAKGDAECRGENLITEWESGRQRERGRQCHRPAHAAPPNHHRAAWIESNRVARPGCSIETWPA